MMNVSRQFHRSSVQMWTLSRQTMTTKTATRRWRWIDGRRKAFSTSAAIGATPQALTQNNRALAWWLAGCAGMVGSMVVVGGLTRLTVSGLSMVDWKPQGSLPPMTREQWVEEFERYKTFPQWKRSERDMTLSEFKTIFYWVRL